jgi:hypothetical protein
MCLRSKYFLENLQAYLKKILMCVMRNDITNCVSYLEGRN